MNKLAVGDSFERKIYLKRIKNRKICIRFFQVFVLVAFLGIWEVLADRGVIDSFMMSQPSRIWKTLINLGADDLLKHIKVTVYETVIGFSVGTVLGIGIAILLWWSDFLSKVFDPYLVVLNSLPKVALRTCYYNLGGCWYSCNYCYGCCYFTYCHNIRKFKWIFAN